MRKNLITLVLFVSFVVSGCVEYKEHVSLNKDGSGTVAIHFAVSDEYFKQMDALMQMTAKMTGEKAETPEAPKVIASKEEIEAFLKEAGEGVKLLEYNRPDSGAEGTVDAKFSFASIGGLDIAASSLFSDQESGRDSISAEEKANPSASFVKQDDGTWLFTRKMETNAEMAEGMGGEGAYEDEGEYGEMGALDGAPPDFSDSADSDEEIEITAEDFVGTDMEALAKDMERAATDAEHPAIVLSVTFPGKALKSNATSVEGATATWSFTLQQISDNPAPMSATIAD